MFRERENTHRPLSRRAKEVLTSQGINTEAVQFLAKGYHHTAFLYSPTEGGKKVLKVPRLLTSAGIVHTAKQEEQNARAVTQTFGRHAVSTQIYENSQGYFVEMDYIQGAPLHADIVDPKLPQYQQDLRSQLIGIIDANKNLLRTSGQFLDLTGAHALFDEIQKPLGKTRSRDLANILVEKNRTTGENTLRIIDNDLVPLHSENPIERLKSMIVFLVNYQAIARDFGLDIRPNKPTQRIRRPR